MNTGFGVAQVSLRFVTVSSDHSVSNHLPSSRRASGVLCVELTEPRCRGRPCQGPCVIWASPFSSWLATTGRPNRVHLRYGLIVHLRLLSTPPRGDAVTVSYGVPEHSGRDLHPADTMQLQAHSSRPPAGEAPRRAALAEQLGACPSGYDPRHPHPPEAGMLFPSGWLGSLLK